MRFPHTWPGIREKIGAPGQFTGNTLTTPLPDGDRGTIATLAAMTALIDNAKVQPQIIELARLISRNKDLQKNFPLAVYQWLQKVQVFEPDPPGQELCRHPVELVLQWSSDSKIRCDCDDVAMFACSLLGAMNINPMLVIYRKSPGMPYVHVAWGFHDPVIGERIPLDSQEKIQPGHYTTRHYKEFPL